MKYSIIYNVQKAIKIFHFWCQFVWVPLLIIRKQLSSINVPTTIKRKSQNYECAIFCRSFVAKWIKTFHKMTLRRKVYISWHQTSRHKYIDIYIEINFSKIILFFSNRNETGNSVIHFTGAQHEVSFWIVTISYFPQQPPKSRILQTNVTE